MLHLRVSGDRSRPAIVFLHAIGTSGWMWEDQFPRLCGFRCLAIDLPGHGLSGSIPWRSMTDTADQIADIIRSEVAGRTAHVIGLSLGAYVGLTLLSRQREVVDRAILSGLNVLPLPHKWLMTISGCVIAPLLKTALGARINARALNIPMDHFGGYRQSLRQLSLRSFKAANDDAAEFSLPRNASEITTPTLLIAGEREHVLIHRSMALLDDVLPHAQERWARGLGHGWCGEAPELFAATVSAWCHDLTLPGELMDHLPGGAIRQG